MGWTDATWNPLRGCSHVSEGCRNCYAERMAVRHARNPLDDALPGGAYHGLVKSTPSGPRWTGKVRFVEDALTLPLRWRTPRRIFVNSKSDLFHERVHDEWIDRIFAVMGAARRHTFQVLTKRPARMLAYFGSKPDARIYPALSVLYEAWRRETGRNFPDQHIMGTCYRAAWPFTNVHLGVSVEDQATADARIPLLLQTPAAVRLVSYEPALGPVDFAPYLTKIQNCWMCPQCGYRTNRDGEPCPNDLSLLVRDRALDWVVAGGESGPGARPCRVSWVRAVKDQCRAAGTPCFVKQLGAHVIDRNDAFGGWEKEQWPDAFDYERVEHHIHGYMEDFQGADCRVRLVDRKGGDPSEWPEDLRVREFPQ